MSFNPEIDENYFARTEMNTENLFTSGISIYILVFYIAGFVITGTITVLMLWLSYNTERWDEVLIKMGNKPVNAYKDRKSKIFSISLTAGILMLYILVLDMIAVVTSKDKPSILTDRNVDDRDLPLIVFSFDSLMVIMWGLCWIPSCMISSRCRTLHNKRYLLQAISTIGPIFTLVVHLPYITISYLNDASYASSIFIYYTVVAFVIFGSLKLTYGTFQQVIHSRRQQNVSIVNHATSSSGREGEDSEELMGRRDVPTFPFCISLRNERVFKCIWCSIGIFFVLLVLVLIGMTTAALVVVPISRAFSDAPNRLLGFYETLIVVAGAYLAYKNIFDKKPTLESAIKRRNHQIPYQRIDGDTKSNDQQQESDSEDEKLAAFYDHVVNIVVNYKTANS